jgi:hypothetical protein
MGPCMPWRRIGNPPGSTILGRDSDLDRSAGDRRQIWPKADECNLLDRTNDVAMVLRSASFGMRAPRTPLDAANNSSAAPAVTLLGAASGLRLDSLALRARPVLPMTADFLRR